jgi:aminoglycoside phosphotransferase family enzyme/predicted kinase
VSTQDDIVRALADPAFYPHRPARVVHHETHISHVFVAGGFAYKLKKDVRFSFADFSTPELRRQLCHEEVRLNRRLCAPLYLGVREVTRGADGSLTLDGDGTPVEPLVWMRALPEDGMLPVALDAGRVHDAHLVRLGRDLVRFHASPDTALADARLAEPDALLERWRHVLADAAPMIGTLLSAADHAVLCEFGEAFVHRHESLLRARAAAGRARDGHGDLHAGNVCLVDERLPAEDGAPALESGLYAFDCLEFSPELRANDVASEVAFLAMDLTARGHAGLARAFVDAYVAASGDDELHVLLPFYACHRASVRGMVHGLAAQSASSDDARTGLLADGRRHFVHATRLAWRAAGAAIVLCTGLSGSGKTTLAVALAETSGFRLLSSDALRKERVGIDPHAPAPAPLRSALYDETSRDAVYAALAEEARRLVAAGEPVLVDATFQRRAQRDRLHAVAREQRVPLVVLDCRAREDVVRARLEARSAHPADASAGQPALSDAGWDVYLAQRAAAEPPADDEPALRIDTSRERAAVREDAVRALWAWRRGHVARAPLAAEA